MTVEVAEMSEVVDEAFVKKVASWGRIPEADNDVTLDLISEAVEYLEAETNRVFLARQVCETYDGYPDDNVFFLQRYPILSGSLDSFEEQKDGEDTWTAVDQDEWNIHLEGRRPTVSLRCTVCRSSITCNECGLRVRLCYTAGFTCISNTPRLFQKSIRELVSFWYRNREPATLDFASPKEVPMGANRVIKQLKNYPMTTRDAQ